MIYWIKTINKQYQLKDKRPATSKQTQATSNAQQKTSSSKILAKDKQRPTSHEQKDTSNGQATSDMQQMTNK